MSRLEWKEVSVLKEILDELKLIRRMLEPKFTLYIVQSGDFMAAITAGQSGSFFLAATASDNSTVALAGPTLTASDTNVSIVPDTTDPTGLTFTVTVPPSDTATTFTLSGSASATSNTSLTPQQLTATLDVTISPASVPVSFTLTINQK